LIIANPAAGTGAAQRRAPRLLTELKRAGVACELAWTSLRDSAATLAEAAPTAEMIVCVGGDGTLNEVVNGLGGRSARVAVFPAGTANVLARDFRLPTSPRRAAKMIAEGRTRRLDVGRVGERRFGLFVGAGLDAAVVRERAALPRTRFGWTAYAEPLVRALRDYDFPPISVVVDGEDCVEAAAVLIANVAGYGGPFRPVPDADPADGRLDVCLMQSGTPRDAARHMWRAARGRLLESEDVFRARGRRIELGSPGDVPVQIDGDAAGQLPVRVELTGEQVQIVRP
jgi:YegS/Rv2252/BmrU family lipid kinase